ncbi:carbohydrate ABC transporter membrane protein 2 (CUT1 family) [Fontibacillus phaseoli]|uniref:Carbohydrate ABC transporter membrane protein 2 (CUT1 family) n=1 Tax=Fontibacillus phaseoli TaxID=1416533 RepID=A0A369BJN6_9BACL|nr:carbohydrate ABC transporter permease [Fontibacillus phaseoli]RCX21611.1 carbohydrate ABC transporter membrane protein 2 (CUT1 family) [Fontibacillus phaseoli]
METTNPSRKIFQIFNITVLTFMAFLCLLPILNLVAVSFSSRSVVEANQVGLWPKGFNISSYEYIFSNSQFFKSLWITVQRTFLGLIVELSLTILVAYPLSKTNRIFRLRGMYVWFFMVTMVFHGGLIPTYLVVNELQLVNSIWALILPEAIVMFNVLLLLNFFRAIPNELEEAALIDGAGWFVTLTRVYLPLSLPSLATITLFILVRHWNSWFDGLIYMNLPDQYPLMTYLQTMVLNLDLSQLSSTALANNPSMLEITGRSLRSAMILSCTLPILLAYPFLQRFFVKGMLLGSVKG